VGEIRGNIPPAPAPKICAAPTHIIYSWLPPAETVLLVVRSNDANVSDIGGASRAMHFSAKRGIEIACRPSVRLSVCLSVCNVGGSGSHRLEILETNCTDN